MSTQLLLHGGRLKLKDQRNDSYFRRLTRDLSDGDDLLFVGFARLDEAVRKEVYEREKGYILAQTDKEINVIYATLDEFETQLADVKVVHITGGESPALVDTIKSYPNFRRLIDGKTVGGSSAGACLFSTKYWYGEENKIYEGLSLFPSAVFVHYGSREYNATEDKLEAFKKQTIGLELITIEECAWIEKLIN